MGGDGDDELTGSDGADILDGEDGDDTASYSNSSSSTRNILLNGETYNSINGVFVRLGRMDFDTSVKMAGALGNSSISVNTAHRYIILKQDGILEGVASITSKNADEFVVVADLATNGDIEWQYRHDGENIFNETTGLTYTLNSAFNTSGLIQNGMAYTASGDEANGDILKNIENLIGSSRNDRLTGDAGDNRLEGGGRTDTLMGGAGDDTLIGGTGSDTLTGGDGEDTASYEEAGSATRTSDITIAASTTNGITRQEIDKGDVTGVYVNLSLTMQSTTTNSDASGDRLTSIENIIGSSHDDLLVGNMQNNILDGGSGDDILIGGAGDDELDGGDGTDRLEGGAGDDTLLGGLGNDILVGGAGDDTLLGGDGMDVLIGGDGSDILIGEGGMDLFRLDLDDDGTDTVLGFTLGEDKIQIDTAFQDDVTLADLGLEIIESGDGLHAHIVNANDNSDIYITIENIDHEELSITDFEII